MMKEKVLFVHNESIQMASHIFPTLTGCEGK